MKLLSAFLLLVLMACSAFTTNPYPDRFVKPAEGEKREDHEVKASQFVVTAQGRYAAEAGREIYARGGNVIDAAIAVSFVISVERPQSTGIGGGGFLLVFKKGMRQPLAFDFREMAPLKAHRKMYLNEQGAEVPRLSLDGYLSVGVPGIVRGLYQIHQEYGKRPWRELIQPAIDLATKGYEVYPELEKAIARRADVLARGSLSQKLFFRADKSPKKVGDRIVQLELAKTLESIAETGDKAFYTGWIAKAIVEEGNKHGSILSLKDFKNYEMKRRVPIVGDYQGYKVFSMPPPSSGGIHVVQILNILEHDDLKALGMHHPKSIHLLASSMQAAFADRSKHLGDEDFVQVPKDILISKKYARDLRFSIPENAALRKFHVHPGEMKKYESTETTHFSLMDRDSMVVSTQTINGYFGSGVVDPKTGIVLNNEMDDFATKVGAKNLFGAVGGEKNLVEPKKRPLSSMSPTIVLREGDMVLGLGTPSGTRILTCVAQTIINYLEHEMPLYDAVSALRVHHQWSPDEIQVEPPGFEGRLRRRLQSMGYQMNEKGLGCRIQAVAKVKNDLIGVSDPRGQGAAVGL